MSINNNTYVSLFEAPVTNTIPYKEVTLRDIYNYISKPYLKKATNRLRSISNKKENRQYKAFSFPYVTFSGIFTERKEAGLVRHSGLMALDFDYLRDVEQVKMKLLKDPCFDTELLFVSPNGNGLKWIVRVNLSDKYPHKTMFQAIYNYIKSTYSLEIDKACKDISRATFLCYDPNAYIHPKYLIDEENV